MRLSSLLNLGLITAGAAASVRTLQRRHQWEQSNTRAYIVLDYDDALAVSTPINATSRHKDMRVSVTLRRNHRRVV